MQNHVRNITRVRTAIPLTTPPAMAPIGVDDEDCDEDDAGDVDVDAAVVDAVEEKRGTGEAEDTTVAGSIKS
jgi:hypothetical protein